MSSRGLQFRMTRSAKLPGAMAPILVPVSPPKALAAVAVVLLRICIGVRPASFINLNSRKRAGPWMVPMSPASVPAAIGMAASSRVFKFLSGDVIAFDHERAIMNHCRIRRIDDGGVRQSDLFGVCRR